MGAGRGGGTAGFGAACRAGTFAASAVLVSARVCATGFAARAGAVFRSEPRSGGAPRVLLFAAFASGFRAAVRSGRAFAMEQATLLPGGCACQH